MANKLGKYKFFIIIKINGQENIEKIMFRRRRLFVEIKLGQ